MTTPEPERGLIVPIDLSNFDKPDRDLVWMQMISEHGTRQVTVTNAGLTLKVQLPNHLQMKADALIPRDRHRGV